MKEALIVLLVWINHHSVFDYDPARGLPEVKTVEVNALIKGAFRGGVPAYVSGQELERMKKTLVAIYNHDERTVYVSAAFDLNAPFGKSVLLHELVHFVQFETGIAETAPCRNALEKDAYRLQKIFMAELGIQPQFDDFTVAMRSACWGAFSSNAMKPKVQSP